MVAGGSAAAAVAGGSAAGSRDASASRRVGRTRRSPHAHAEPSSQTARVCRSPAVRARTRRGRCTSRGVGVGVSRDDRRHPRTRAACAAHARHRAVDEEDDVRPTRGDGSRVLARVRRRVDETRGEDVVARARGCRGWFLQDVVARALAPRVQSPAGRVVRVDARDGEPPSPVERVPRRRHRRGARHQPRVARVAPGPPVGKEPALVPRPRAHRVARARRGLTRWAPASPEGKRRRHVVLARGARKFSPLRDTFGERVSLCRHNPRRSPTDRDDDDGHPGDGEGAQGAQGC